MVKGNIKHPKLGDVVIQNLSAADLIELDNVTMLNPMTGCAISTKAEDEKERAIKTLQRGVVNPPLNYQEAKRLLEDPDYGQATLSLVRAIKEQTNYEEKKYVAGVPAGFPVSYMVEHEVVLPVVEKPSPYKVSGVDKHFCRDVTSIKLTMGKKSVYLFHWTRLNIREEDYGTKLDAEFMIPVFSGQNKPPTREIDFLRKGNVLDEVEIQDSKNIVNFICEGKKQWKVSRVEVQISRDDFTYLSVSLEVL
jgi:hypothetical protein